MTSARPAGSDLSLLRRLNQREALAALRRARDIRNLAELVQETGLSRPTVEAALADLADAGLVEELSPAASGRAGRPAKRFRFRADRGHIAGVDVGRHKILVLLADLNGEVLTEHRQAVPDRDFTTDVVAAAVRAAQQQAALPPDGLLAATFGVPGVVDAEGRITRSVVLPAWIGLEIAGTLGAELGCPVRVDNDAKLATVAEHTLGAGIGATNMVYVLAGLRLAAGCVINGHLYRGSTGAAAEIGAMPEMRWASAFERFAASLPHGSDGEDDVAAVFAAAGRGDRGAASRVTAFAQDIAHGLTALVLAYDPELVVIGGGFSLSGETMLNPLRGALAASCLSQPPVVAGTLGATATARGGLCVTLGEVERDVLDLAG